MDIKPLEEENRQAAATLLRQYWKERNMVYTQKWAEQYLEIGHKVEIKKDKTFVLKEGIKVIGTIALVLWEGNVAELRDLVVKKEERGKGYGKKLLQFAIDWSQRNNAHKVFALTFQQYKQLFLEHNFVLEGFLKDHFKLGEHLLLMSRFLERKRETQVNLRTKLDDVQKTRAVEEETSLRLRKLSTR